MSTKKLEYSELLPLQPGLYWAWSKVHNEAEIKRVIKVTPDNRVDTEKQLCIVENYRAYPIVEFGDAFFWAGPIEEPKNPKVIS